MRRQTVVQGAKWGVSLVILWVLVTAFDPTTLRQSLAGADASLLLLALVLGFVGIGLGALRWRVSLSVQGIEAPYRRLLSSTLVSGFLGFFLPSFGEDAVRGVDFYKFGPKRGIDIAASILFERICGLLGQAIVGGIALALHHERIADRTIVHAAVLLYAAIVAALVVVFQERLSTWLVSWLRRVTLLRGIADQVDRLSAAIQRYRNDLRAWVAVLGASFVFQFAGFLYFFVIARSLGIDIGLSAFVLLVPIVTVLSLVPISIGGLGVKEALFVVLFAQLAVDREHAFLISAVGSALYLLFVLLGGLVFLLRKAPARSLERRSAA